MTEQEPQRHWEKIIEIIEVSVLALVAIATAFSGYQGTKWGGAQALLYGQASTARFQADALASLGEQQLAADASLLTAWLQAHEAGDAELETLLERRFTPDYAVAFQAWVQTDPFTNPDAPPGPGYMPGFTNPNLAKAAEVNAQAQADFAEGTASRETANKYVRNTVLFASVLFLVAIAQRFRLRGVRIGANALAVALLVYSLREVLVLPRL